MPSGLPPKADHRSMQLACRKRAMNRHVLHLCLPARGSLATGYIGGGIPSLPTVTRSASNAPSGVLVAAGIKIFAFGFSSLRSPGTSVTTLSDVTVTVLVPPLKLTVTSFPSTLLTLLFSTLLDFWATVPLVMLLFGAAVPLVMLLFGVRSHARFPSPVPRIDSGKIWTSIACSLPSVPGVAAVPIKLPGLISDSDALATDTIFALSAK